jgi:tRNA A-37 threonylcarbamoyl transferase component Bud32
MSSARIPWWIWLIAASFIACFVVGFLYLPFRLPEPTGFTLSFRENRVASVTPGSPAEAAGVKPDDRIIGVDGRAVQNIVELGGAVSSTAFDHPVSIVVLRGGEEVRLQLTLNRKLTESWTSKEYLGWWVEFGVSLIQLLVGLLVLFKRPRDLTAVAAGIFLCSLGTGNTYFLYPSSGVIWRNLPLAIQWLIFPGVILGANGFPVGPMLLFSLSFPKPLLHRRWAWIVLVALAAPLLGSTATLDYIVLFDPKRAVGAIPDWLGAVIGIDLLVVFLGSVLIVAVNYFRLREVNEKRRIRLVVFGLLLFFVDFLAFFLFLLSRKTSWIAGIAISPLMFGLAQVPFTICVAYAVLKQRLFQVSFIVRQSLQYAVARGALLIPIPIMAGILIFDLVVHKDQPFGVLLSAHGWAYALMGVAGIVAHKKKSQWMEVLDRRFYREHYNAQQLLRQTVDEIRASSNLAEVAPKAVARIEQALHPEFVAILMREAAEPTYRCIASAPAEIYPRGLSAESKLMSAFRLFAKPLQISLAESGWLKQQLPSEDTNFLRDARIDLMVPIAIAPHGREALMVLGLKKSEEPYSGEDQELLSGIGSALALLLERPVTTTLGGFEECPRCGLCYESGMGRCSNEGTQLTQMPFKRLLTSRYRLERRLGRGGMGTVYKATDTSLERAVAVKLIREDLVTSRDAAERFRREAKAAASFAHPNLVTVHDFGVDSETRVFLVMELLEGFTLRQRFEQQRKFATQQILQVLAGVGAGLEAAHENGLIHRDLKPENIFLAQSGGGEVAKILDFGLAKFLVSPTDPAAATVDTVPGVLMGTPQYMSPDQLNGEVASAAWDIWALAVITYEMLTGTHPFPATSVGQMHHSIVYGRFTPLSTHCPDAPAEWQQFFERALSPKTAQRPQSAKEFVSSMGTAFAFVRKEHFGISHP